MKNRFLLGSLFALLMVALLGASNIPQGWTWNSTLNAFQVLLKDGGGTKMVPTADDGSFSAPFTGPCSMTSTVKWLRVKNSMTLFIPANTCAASTGAVFTASGAIPTGLRPPMALSFAVLVRDAGTDQTVMGYVEVNSNGNLRILKTWAGASFSSSGSAGNSGNVACTYSLN